MHPRKKKQPDLLIEFEELSRRILDAKILYYSPLELSESFVELNMPSNTSYDAMEARYLDLCEKLGRPNVLVSKHVCLKRRIEGEGMFSVDHNRADVKAAYSALLAKQSAKKTG